MKLVANVTHKTPPIRFHFSDGIGYTFNMIPGMHAKWSIFRSLDGGRVLARFARWSNGAWKLSFWSLKMSKRNVGACHSNRIWSLFNFELRKTQLWIHLNAKPNVFLDPSHFLTTIYSKHVSVSSHHFYKPHVKWFCSRKIPKTGCLLKGWKSGKSELEQTDPIFTLVSF